MTASSTMFDCISLAFRHALYMAMKRWDTRDTVDIHGKMFLLRLEFPVPALTCGSLENNYFLRP